MARIYRMMMIVYLIFYKKITPTFSKKLQRPDGPKIVSTYRVN